MKKFGLVISFISLFAMQGMAQLSLATDDASSITSTGATLNGTISEIDGRYYTAFRYVEVGNTDTSEVFLGPTTTTGSFSTTLTGLNSNSEYFYLFVIDDYPNGYIYGLPGKTFTTLKGEPSTQITDITFGTITSNSIAVNWTGGDGDSVMIVAKAASSINNSPIDQTEYYGNSVFNNGQSTIGSGEYVVYNDARSTGTVTVTGLTAGVEYFFRAFTYNNSGADVDFNISAGSGANPTSTTTAQAEPTEQATLSSITGVTQTSMTINWTGGNGSATIVAVSTSNAVTPTPQDNTTYTASSNFSVPGTEIQSSGYYTVYNESGSSVTVTGLTANTTYYVEIFEYNGDAGSENYYVTHSGNTGSQTTLKEEPTTQVANITFGTITSNSIVVNWTGGDGDSVMIVAKAASSINNSPIDQTEYYGNSVFNNGQSTIGSGEYVVYNDARSTGTVTVTGLTAGVEYFFRAFTYNNSGADVDFNISAGSGANPTSTTTAQAEPTEQATLSSITGVTQTSMTINWTGGNGSATIVAVSTSDAVTPTPQDNATYTASSNFAAPGTEIQSSGYYTVYNESGSSVTVTGLTANTTYYVEIFEYNGDAGSENYYVTHSGNTGSQTTLKEAPTQQVSSFSFSSIALDQMTINWTGGNGDNVLVFAKAGSAITDVPTESTTYNASTTFGSGTALDGGYTVYNGAIDGDDASGITITSLGTGDTEYYYRAFAYNNSGASKEINFSGGSTGQYTLDTEPAQATSISFDNVTHEQMDISWTSTGDGSLVIVREASAVATDPTDATTYTTNTTFGTGGTEFGSGYAVYASTGTSVTVTGLSAQTTYHVEVFSYNNSPGVINYNNTTASNTGSQATTAAPAPTVQASNITFTPVSTTSMTIGWASGNGDKRIVAVREGTQGSITNPTDNTSYAASATWGDTGNQTQLGTSGYYTVYNGTGNSVTLTNLSTETTYWVQVFEYNNVILGTEIYNTNTATNNPLSGTTLKGQPTTEASNITASNIKVDQMTISCIPGDGDYRIIVASANSGSWSPSPTDETTYAANANFGDGDEIGASSGNYVVYNGSGSSVTVTGLPSEGTEYYYKVYEYNNVAGFEDYTSAGSTQGSGFTGSGLKTWVGGDTGNESDWHTGANWSPSGVPDGTHDVNIPSTPSDQPEVTSTTTVANVTVEAGAYLTLTSGTLNVTNEFLLESPSGNGMPGALIAPASGGTLSAGTSTIQRSFQTFASLRSHFYCSPLTSQVTGDFLGFWVGDYIESSTNWSYFSTLTDGLSTMKGYEVVKSVSAQDVLSFSGTFNNDIQTTLSLSNSSPGDNNYGWYLVGNPYPSTINIGGTSPSGVTFNNLDAAVYVYNASIADYETYTTGTASNVYIAPMQAFFVHVTGSTNGAYGVTNAARTANAVNFKSTTSSQHLALNISNEQYNTKTEIRFEDDATDDFDAQYDAYKLFPADWQANDSVPKIYTILEDADATLMSINTLSTDKFNNIDANGFKINTGIKKGISTVLTISLDLFKPLAPNIDVILIDNLENNQVSLLDGDYTFTMLEEDDSRFDLLFIPTRIIVESLEVESTLINDSIFINDTTIFTAKATPFNASNQSVTWSVNDSNIGTIDANTGLFSAKKDGIVQVKATAKDGTGIFASKDVTVYSQAILTTSIEVKHNEESNNIPINTTVEMQAVILPTNTTNQAVTWSVDNTSIASIDEHSGILTALKNGVVKVTATTKDDSGKSGSIELTLFTPAVLANSIEIYHNEEDNNIPQNTTLQLHADILPVTTSVQTKEWSVDNSDLASIETNTGLLTSKAEGTVIVTATCKDGTGVLDTIHIHIVNSVTYVTSIDVSSSTNSDSLEVNSQRQLIANILPLDASIGTVTWESENTQIAVVNSTGLVTGKSSGTVTITATANDGSGIVGSIMLTVYNYTDIDDNINEKLVKFYPNPTNGNLFIETKLDNCTYSIFNNLGKKLMSNEFSYSETVNLSNLNNGVYYIEFISDSNRQIEIFVKE